VSKQQVDYYIDNKDAIPSAKPTLASIMVEVLQKWHTDPQYVGPYGIPLELEFEVASGGRCFRTLVGLVDETVSPGIVLEELLRVGSVTYSGEQHFRAVSRYFMMPEPMSPQQVENFGNTLTRLAQTLEFNMDPKNSNKRLERFVLADRGLPARCSAEVRELCPRTSDRVLLDLDNWLTPYSASNSADDSPRIASGLNIFLYVDPPADEKALARSRSAHAFTYAINRKFPSLSMMLGHADACYGLQATPSTTRWACTLSNISFESVIISW
jgi:hypothetical protein